MGFKSIKNNHSLLKKLLCNVKLELDSSSTRKSRAYYFLARARLELEISSFSSSRLGSFGALIRHHLINNGLLPRIHGNIKRMPQ